MSLLRLFVAVTLGVAGLSTAQAREFTCESQDRRRAECAAPERGAIRLQRQLSKTDCVEGRTWGQTGSGVYVSGGCRAVFYVEGRGAVHSAPGRDRDTQRDRGLPSTFGSPQSGRRSSYGHGDVVGERQVVAQNTLVERGYELLGSVDGPDRRWTYFYTPDRRQCLQAVIYQGRVSQIDAVGQSQCRRGDLTVWGAGSAQRAADGYRDDRPDSRYDERRDGRYEERGYDDRGYDPGYDDRRHDDRYDNRSGYNDHYRYEDLIGARASSAEADLQARGYRYRRTDSGRRSDYVYYESADRRQCLRATLRDGRYVDIVERDRSDCR